MACTLSEAVPLPSRTHFVLYTFCWRKTIKEKLPNKKWMKKKQKLSIDISDDGDHGTSQRRERQPQSSWYLSQRACSFFSACCRSSSKWAMANALPRPSALDASPTASLRQTALPSGAVVSPWIFHPWSSTNDPLTVPRAEPIVSCVEPIGHERVLCLPCKKSRLHGRQRTRSSPSGSTQETIGSALDWANLPTRFGSLWKRAFFKFDKHFNV